MVEPTRKHDMADNNWIKEEGNFSTVTRGSFETDSFKWVSAILAVLSEMLEIKERKNSGSRLSVTRKQSKSAGSARKLTEPESTAVRPGQSAKLFRCEFGKNPVFIGGFVVCRGLGCKKHKVCCFFAGINIICSGQSNVIGVHSCPCQRANQNEA